MQAMTKPYLGNVGAQPLVTFAIFAYNQQQFIEEAVESALAQTYSPLEIILSDDCSTDQTFTIIQQIVAAYKGAHKLVVNRNKHNLGLCAHVNSVCAIAKGSWLVAAAGDDISLPERTSVLMEQIKKYPDATYINSQAIVFNENGSDSGQSTSILNEPIGATEAFSLENFKRFGPLRTDTFSEDWALYFRGQLRGRVLFVNRPLIRYRSSSSSLSASLRRGILSNKLSVNISDLRQFASDAATMKKHQSSRSALTRVIQIKISLCEKLLRRAQGGRISCSDVWYIVSKSGMSALEKASLVILYMCPTLYSTSERLRRSRFNLFAHTRYSNRCLSPFPLLEEGTRCP
jgi:glycosyltransferase involved in cell wall biosynthesis